MKIALVVVQASKMRWFLCAGKKWLIFTRDKIDMVFWGVVEIDLVLCAGRKMTWSCGGIDIDLVACGWSKLT